MDPSIEVQISAKIDKLDSALKVAESKVSQSSEIMGKAGAVEINAKLDQLDDGLKAAEEKVSESVAYMSKHDEVKLTVSNNMLDAGFIEAEKRAAKTITVMDKIGDEAGNSFVNKILGHVIKGLAMGAITNVVGGGLLNLAKGINAEKSGQQIGEDISKGIIDGAKGIPVIGVFVTILDEVVNGFDRIVDAQFKSMMVKAGAFSDMIAAKMASTISASQAIENKLKYIEAGDDPKKKVQVEKEIQIQQANDRLKAIEDEKQAAIVAFVKVQNAKKEAIDKEEASLSMTGAGLRAIGNDQMTSFDNADAAKAQIDKETERGKKALRKTNEEENKIAELKIAIEKDTASKLAAIDEKDAADKKEKLDKADQQSKEAAQKAIDLAKKVEEEKEKNAQDAADAAVEIVKKQRKAEFEAAIQAQQDIIDANKQAQIQIDKIGRVNQLAGQAARGMINSGQTALGQFNFAQAGAGADALDLAKKQVASLDAIDKATAEQVRLTKANQGFQ
ncbi:hypothetical protein UFOVP1116_23 [uncultured Caudovirales phage]|uniref:Uncharacterized protein n=1 Tax=uncultured Caudovirales phage TaxID=2100421 RepID=A0A6J5QJ48_9CAUD|nr:hypothetical protein UFOVP1116_23 [uncultured Caudovirales phage]CAB4204218.1 hypothetical protein UFOVP1391_43 [uncultured Caudovirales phage]CAB4215440.1 hypothetical protein UFOVP1480_16 [uncultured Caudovirales phage]CAB5230096.1 hypothetical protein UFOVP1568_36 [uncultured Caudovirales phage]